MTKMNGSDGGDEQAMLAEFGRATARLIHDFKNQLGGLKLYTAYLKKRFAAHPDLAEGLEIADKIAQSVNEMAENANLIGKLARPIELKLTEAQFTSLVEHALNRLQPQIAERRLEVKTELVATPLLKMDSQQTLSAIGALLTRAIEALPENGRLRLTLQNPDGELQFSIVDEGSSLTKEQRQSFFDFLTNERLNKTSLNLALAKRIMEAQGWQIAALVAEPAGTEIRVTIRI
ncbi:MAG: sensor histidine kinase [Blastocatellia bacterium]